MNPHRGSDFNEFLAKERIMTPTPRTDAIAHRGLGSVAYISEMTSFARELEAELAAERALVAVWKHEAKRLEEQLKAMEQTAIEWWCEYQELKDKAGRAV